MVRERHDGETIASRFFVARIHHDGVRGGSAAALIVGRCDSAHNQHGRFRLG
jgi:hypothetical protein